MANGLLGCANDYVVQLNWVARIGADGEPLPQSRLHSRGRLTGVTRIQWSRAFNDIAGATIEVGSDEGAAPCLDLLSEIVPSVHEVAIYRMEGGGSAGERVFEGPITSVMQATDTQMVTIEAGDICTWFSSGETKDEVDHGYVLNKTDMQYQDTDPVLIAEDIIVDNMTGPYADPDDPALILDYLYTNTVGTAIDYTRGITFEYIIDTLDDLTKFGLLYAAVGRRLILSSPADTDSPVRARLTPRHFSSGVEVTYNGNLTGTYGWAVANGANTDDDVRAVGYGTVASVYGIRESRVDVDRDTSDADMETAARRAIQGHQTVPVEIAMPTNATLLPSAPIEITQVRPGTARVDVFIEDIFRPVRQACMIAEMEVDWSPGLEEVKVTLEPIGPPTAIIPNPPPPIEGGANE